MPNNSKKIMHRQDNFENELMKGVKQLNCSSKRNCGTQVLLIILLMDGIIFWGYLVAYSPNSKFG